MFKQGIRLEEIAYNSYKIKAKSVNLFAKVEKEKERYAFAEIESSPLYSSFSRLLDELKDYIMIGCVRLLHTPGKSYSESEKELNKRKDDPNYYSELEKRADKENALNVEFNLLPGEGIGKTFRGSKLMFKRNGKLGMIYLAKAYLHKDEAELLGVYCNIKKDFHGVSAINKKSA